MDMSGDASPVISLFYRLGYMVEELQAGSGKAGAAVRRPPRPRRPPDPDLDEDLDIDDEYFDIGDRDLDYDDEGLYDERLDIDETWPGLAPELDEDLDEETAAKLNDAAPENRADYVPRMDVSDTVKPLIIGYLLSKVLKVGRVNWPLAILGGVVGSSLAALAEALQTELAPQPVIDGLTPAKEDAMLEEEARERAPLEMILRGAEDARTRYTAGVATAIAYGAMFYPRLPGPPMMRGIAFGALDLLLIERGGLAPSIRQLSPRFAFPMAGLAGPVSNGTMLGHLAFGLGLGLVYRPNLDNDDDDDDDDGDDDD
jgi:hypothetical protein